jgi:hypothetical protein
VINRLVLLERHQSVDHERRLDWTGQICVLLRSQSPSAWVAARGFGREAAETPASKGIADS